MNGTNVWERAKSVFIQKNCDIGSGFNIGFDERIPDEIREELRTFVRWVEANYSIPVELWVDFEYKHYLLTRKGKRVGYLFYWSDFPDYPVFSNADDAPIIKLPVRTEKSALKDILGSFIEAITDYFAWLCNEVNEDSRPDERYVDEILETYMNFRETSR